MKKPIIILILLIAGQSLNAVDLYIAYCKDAAHTDSVVMAASDQACSCSEHGTHTDMGTLTKTGVDYQALLATHGSGLFAYLETTYGSEMN